MRISSLLAVAAAALTLGVSIAACSTTNNNGGPSASSGPGESCSQTADCKTGMNLVCINLTCVAGAAPTEGGASSGGSSGGTSSSGSGSGSGSGGSSGGSGGSSGGQAEAAAAHLGVRGDACTATPQCAAGLECVVLPGQSIGICDLASYGLSGNAGGKVCGGECRDNMAGDCCELPVDTFIIGTTAIHHCADLQTLINGQTCPGSGDVSTLGQACFLFSSYCGSCGSSWTCTNNQCVFTAPCTQGNTGTNPGVGGCAPFTRLGHTLTTTCNTSNNTCTTTTSTTGCTSDSSCANTAYYPFPGSTGGICKAPGGSGDCVCKTGVCYLACSKDLDCATGYTCDTANRLCKPVGGCTANYQCVNSTHNVLSTCVSGVCTQPCTSDHDCSAFSGSSQLQGGSAFGTTVCVIPSGTTTGTCQPLSCTMDTDCNTASSSSSPTPHTFCVAQPTTTGAVAEVSAITN